MYRIALNVAISFYRSESRREDRSASLEGIEPSEEPLSGDPRVERLLECIDQLGPFDKALVLMHLDGYPHADIAGVLGITPTNASTKLARIKERLRATMTVPPTGVNL
jgi:RNA polymerase sigma-70 factor (ECF subfamily)